MREALARSDFNAVRRAPAQTRGSRQGKAESRRQNKYPARPTSHLLTIIEAIGIFFASAVGAALAFMGRRLISAVLRQPVAVIGGLAGFSLATAIVINAISLQEGHHPSPMFANGQMPKAAALKSKSVSLPPARPVTTNAPKAIETPLPSNTIAPAQPELQRPAANDPIAHLITKGALPPQPGKPLQNGIMAIQQALVKLGYSITPDGLAGPATQQAIAAFEKVEDLPITGDPSNAAMRKALSVASGIALN